jgi:hypothetical protein
MTTAEKVAKLYLTYQTIVNQLNYLERVGESPSFTEEGSIKGRSDAIIKNSDGEWRLATHPNCPKD